MTKNKELKKVLYVEDDEDIAQIVKMTFEEFCKSGEFKHCICGEGSLKILPKFKPDLVLLDMMMPDMDGLETMKRMRKIKEGKDLPIIFMTAKMQKHEQQSYLDAGAIGVITKPFNPMALCDEVHGMWNSFNDAKKKK